MNSLPKTAKPQSLCRSIDKNLAASQEDIILQMMINEARNREQLIERRQKQRLGATFQYTYPFIKIEDSEEEIDEDMGFRLHLPKIEEKQRTCMIKKGILNIKIAGKIKKGKKGQRQGCVSQGTLDKYVAKQVGNPRKNRSKLKSFVDSTQTTLDRFISKLKVSEN